MDADRHGATSLARSVALVCAASAIVGVAFGAASVSAGLPMWLPIALSLLVFAGSAQFLFVALVAADASLLTAAAASLLVNARLVALGMAVADLLGHRWSQRLLGAHLLVDETVAFALTRPDPARRRTAYWACGIALFCSWNLGVLLGASAGTLAPDTDALGLDAAFPAVLLALVVPALRDRSNRRAAVAGATIALATSPLLPPGLPVVLALAGVLTALPRRDTSTTSAEPREASS